MDGDGEVVRHKSERGEVTLRRLRPGHVLVTIAGHHDLAATQFLLMHFERELRESGAIHINGDGRLVKSFSADSRERVGEWLNRHKTQVVSSRVLYQSTILKMAISLVNMFTRGRLEPHSTERTFVAAIARDVPGFTHLPRVADAEVPSRPDASG